MNAVLILGAGVMQGPAIRIARQKGYRVHAADGNSSAVHASTVDEFHHIDLKDAPALTAAAAGIEGLAGVFTAGTDFSASVAYVAEKLGLPGIPYEVALDASDKSRMRARLKSGGVPVPDFAFGTSADDPVALASRVAPLPLVVKPVDNMGSRGCRLARTVDELQTAWHDAVSNSRTGRAIIEAYLEGPEFSIDAVVYRGEIVLRGIADRIVVFEPFFVEMGHTMPSAYGQEIVDEVVEVFKAGVKALGIGNGTAKGDIKYTRKGAFVGEIAARLSGGYMSGWTYPYSSGIEATAEALDIACGVQPVFKEPAFNLVCSERAWISIPGTVASVHNLDTARTRISADGAVRDVFPRAGAGDTVVFPGNNVEKCGNILSVAPTRILADSMAEEVARSILIRLMPSDPATDSFLEGKGRIMGPHGVAWPPDACAGLSAMTLAALEKMPAVVRDQAPRTTVSIAPLAGVDAEGSVDWQGRSISESLRAVAELTGAKVGLEGDLVLGGVFWKAFIRGGYQAGAYIVDSMRGRGGMVQP